MEQHQSPEEAAESGKAHLKAAAGDINEAVSAKVEDIRQAAAEKANQLRERAQGKVQELKGAAESAWSDAKSWQVESETNIRNNPTKAVLIALGAGFVLGLVLRK